MMVKLSSYSKMDYFEPKRGEKSKAEKTTIKFCNVLLLRVSMYVRQKCTDLQHIEVFFGMTNYKFEKKL